MNDISFEKALTNVIGQYFNIEESHYEETGKPEDHIFLQLKVLRDYLEIIRNGKN